MSITIRTNKEVRFGTTVILAGAGKVDISAEGTFDVPTQEIANEVEASHEDFYIVDGSFEKIEEDLKTKSEENELGKGQGDDIGVSEDEKDELIKSLSSQTVAQLKVHAANFPPEEWENLKKAELIEYLTGKL